MVHARTNGWAIVTSKLSFETPTPSRVAKQSLPARQAWERICFLCGRRWFGPYRSARSLSFVLGLGLAGRHGFGGSLPADWSGSGGSVSKKSESATDFDA